MRFSQLTLVILASGSVASCSVFTRPQEKPVIEEGQRTFFFAPTSLGVLAVTPERRVILHNFSNGRFCAENPTEVGIDLSSAIRVIASADIQDKSKAEIGLALAAASRNSALNKRSQGMQLYLAGVYSLCQMYMNNAIDETSLVEQQLKLVERAAELIKYEFQYFYRQETHETETALESSPPGTPVTLKTLDEMSPVRKTKSQEPATVPTASAASAPSNAASASSHAASKPKP